MHPNASIFFFFHLNVRSSTDSANMLIVLTVKKLPKYEFGQFLGRAVGFQETFMKKQSFEKVE